jgi:hypothetical protein
MMPKLLYFLPCDRVILSQDLTVSLITLIENVNISIPVGEAVGLPDEAGVPKEWNVISSFEWEDLDAGKTYEQRVYLVLSNGRVAVDIVASISSEPGKKRSRNIVKLLGFPVAPMGDAALRLAIREVGQEGWQEISEYTIGIIHNQDGA